jgi:hypothetical protein
MRTRPLPYLELGQVLEPTYPHPQHLEAVSRSEPSLRHGSGTARQSSSAGCAGSMHSAQLYKEEGLVTRRPRPSGIPDAELIRTWTLREFCVILPFHHWSSAILGLVGWGVRMPGGDQRIRSYSSIIGFIVLPETMGNATVDGTNC